MRRSIFFLKYFINFFVDKIKGSRNMQCITLIGEDSFGFILSAQICIANILAFFRSLTFHVSSHLEYNCIFILKHTNIPQFKAGVKCNKR